MSKQEGWMRRVELVVVVIAVLVIALAYAISRMTASCAHDRFLTEVPPSSSCSSFC
jgi:hypothetical protein